MTMLGMAKKAGALLVGQKACEEAIVSGKAKLILLAKDAGRSTRRNFLHLSKKHEVELFEIADKQALGKPIGFQKAAVIAVTDFNWTKTLKESLNLGV